MFCVRESHVWVVEAARQFYKKFIQVMTSSKIKFEKYLADGYLLKRENKYGILIVCIYVDDTMCIGTRKAIDQFKKELKEFFSTKDEGKMEEYVGCSVIRKGNGKLIMHQPHLLRKIKREFGEELIIVREFDTPDSTGDTVIRAKEDDDDAIFWNQ